MEIIFYETDQGVQPAREFMIKQSAKMRAKIVRTMELLEEKGVSLRMPHSENLGEGIYQLRAQTEGEKAILTNGFIKKTARTPKIELDKAKKYREEYLQRMNGNDV